MTDPDVSQATADPALDTLIDCWLSNRLASTSAADNHGSSGTSRSTSSNSSSRSGKRSKQQSTTAASNQLLSDSLEAVLGPVSSTLGSLASLDDVSCCKPPYLLLCILLGKSEAFKSSLTKQRHQPLWFIPVVHPCQMCTVSNTVISRLHGTCCCCPVGNR